MMLQLARHILPMTPWEVIEEALRRKRPAKKPAWLAERLAVTAQVVSNWKTRRVPPERYREIAEALDLTVDQLEGVAPLPWESTGWPFPGIDQARFDRLDQIQKGEIQGKVREMIEEFENFASRPGKLSNSR